jgi:hypothetical protein
MGPDGVACPWSSIRADTGSEPVREWLKELDPEDRKMVGTDLLRVQELWPIGMPLCRSLRKGLWEVRTNLPSNRSALMCYHPPGSGRAGFAPRGAF